MKKVLVTGADGFIGSHLVEELVKRGYKVRAFCLYNSFNSLGWIDKIDKKIRSDIEVFSGNIEDPFGVKKAMEGCDLVFHLAALIAIPYSYHSPASYISTNVMGTLNIVQAARDLGVDKVVHTSTSETYGSAQYVPIDESHPLVGQSPYSASKIGADQIAISYYKSFQTPISIIRPFNTFGPRQSARAVIPTIITQIANGVKEIKLGSLGPTRDFTYVLDTIDGFISIAESKKTVGEVINIGSNFEISINDTAKLIANLMSKEVEFILDPQRVRPKNSEVDRLYCSNAKAKDLLGWEPKFSGRDSFSKGLICTINWFTQNENLSFYKHMQYNI